MRRLVVLLGVLAVLGALALVVVTYSPPAAWRRWGFSIAGMVTFGALTAWAWSVHPRMAVNVVATFGWGAGALAYGVLGIAPNTFGASSIDTMWPYLAALGFAAFAIAGVGWWMRIGGVLGTVALVATGILIVIAAGSPDSWAIGVLRLMDVLLLAAVAALAWAAGRHPA